jgi:DNA-binding transcriptional LysR family regulator
VLALLLYQADNLPAYPAKIHVLNWNDLQFVLALAREGSYAAAARSMRIDPTTVARRIHAIESALGATLFERHADGRMCVTDVGEIAVKRAESIELEVGHLDAAISGADAEVSGSVRVTAVPIIVNRVLIPAAPSLIAKYPDLRIELIGDPRDLNIARRDADIAVRLARPGNHTGERILARKICTIAYAVYGPRKHRGDPARLPWLGYDDSLSHLPHAKWIRSVIHKAGDAEAALTINDAEGVLQSIQAGLGRSVLPCIVADSIPEVARLSIEKKEPLPTREVWTLTHPDIRHLARIEAVLTWIEATLTAR